MKMYIVYVVRPQTPKVYRNYFKRGEIIELKGFMRLLSLLKNMKAISEIKTIAKKRRYDIIHLCTSKVGVIDRFPNGEFQIIKETRQMFKIIKGVCAKTNYTSSSCSYDKYEKILNLTKKLSYMNNAIDTAQINEVPQFVGRWCQDES